MIRCLMRGGFGNPFDVSTQSGGALALELRDSIVASLKARGITAYPVTVSISDKPADARRHATRAGLSGRPD